MEEHKAIHSTVIVNHFGSSGTWKLANDLMKCSNNLITFNNCNIPKSEISTLLNRKSKIKNILGDILFRLGFDVKASLQEATNILLLNFQYEKRDNPTNLSLFYKKYRILIQKLCDNFDIIFIIPPLRRTRWKRQKIRFHKYLSNSFLQFCRLKKLVVLDLESHSGKKTSFFVGNSTKFTHQLHVYGVQKIPDFIENWLRRNSTLEKLNSSFKTVSIL